MQFTPLPSYVLKEKGGREKMQHNIGEKTLLSDFQMDYPLSESTFILVTRSSQHELPN